MDRKFKRSFDELKEIVALTNRFFNENDIDPSLRYVVDLAAEELFVNMVTYNVESNQDILIQMSPHECTSSEHMGPLEPFSKRHFSARTFSSLAC